MCNQSRGALGKAELKHWVLGFLASFWHKVVQRFSQFVWEGFLVELGLFV